MEKLTLPSGVTHRHEPDVDIVAWETNRTSVNWDNLIGLSVGAIFIVGALLLFTHELFSNEMSDKSLGEWVGVLVFYGFVWFMIAGFLAALQSVTWTEEIQISDTDIVVMHSGRYAPKKKLHFHKNTVYRLALDDAPGEQESCGLCIYYRNPKSIVTNRPQQLAVWMREETQYQLLQLLHQILDRRGWQIAHNMIYKISDPIDTATLPPIPTPPPQNKPVKFSQEAIDFVVHELGIINRNDIIIKLCQHSGCHWEQASALVTHFESIMFAQKPVSEQDK